MPRLRGAATGGLWLLLAGCATVPHGSMLTKAGNPSASPSDETPATAATAGVAPTPSTNAVVVNTPDSQNTELAQYPNLWDRIRAGFRLPPMEGPYVAEQEQWFEDNPDYMDRMLERANLYLYQIVQEVAKRHMPMEIALLPAIESAYKPSAYSRARAVGLWQFTLSTGRLYGLKSNWWYDERRDILASTRAALDYLQKLHDDFNGNWDLALAAYNAGEGNVLRAIAHNRRLGLSTDYSQLPLPRETELYVPKLMAMVNIVRDPAKFGLQLREIPDSPYFVKVRTRSPVDLGVVAKLANVSVEDLYRMNPAFNHWTTGFGGPKHLLVPVSAKEAVVQGLKDMPPQDLVQWAQHRVRYGESLYEIARHYGVTVGAIREANHLHSNLLRPREVLLIPVAGRRLVILNHHPSLEHPVERGHHELRLHTASAGQRIRVVHRVRPGDTLWSIARRYNVYVNQLARWNTIGARDALRLGQHILIWTTPQVASAAER